MTVYTKNTELSKEKWFSFFKLVFGNRALGSSKSKNSWQAVSISMLLV